MKKTVKTILGILLFVVIGTSVYSQDKTMFDLHNYVKFDKASKPTEMKIEVTSDQCYLELSVNCRLTDGDLKIEIYDEKGKKQASFSTGGEVENKIAKSDSDIQIESQKTVSGRLAKENVSIGTWAIRIIPNNATGDLTLQYRQRNSKEN